MKKILLLLLPIWVNAQNIQLQNFLTGFTRPIDLQHCGDERLFIVEQRGVIKLVQPGATTATTFMDISARVRSTGNEQGLLGLAFHPNYKTNGYFYVNYINGTGAGKSRISRFSVNSADPSLADPNSELILMEITQPYTNHNGGQITFGADGYLYTALGDGGSANDPGRRAQNTLSYFGKMLRLDVDNPQPPLNYGIPSSNPFVALSSHYPEIWSYGLRNTWRFSFDRNTNDMWMGDVGQYDWEEVNFEPAGHPGGSNYGWVCREGLHANPGVSCTVTNAVDPVAEFDHATNNDCSITGGFVYRGCMHPSLYGYYFYTDFCSGIFRALPADRSAAPVNVLNGADNQFVSFGQDINGEVFVLELYSGAIRRIVAPATASAGPAATITNGGNLLTSSPAATYQWLLDGAPIQNATSQTYSPTSNGVYQVSITLANGCRAISSPLDFVVGVDEPSNSPICTLSPNPASEILNVDITLLGANDVTIEIANALGQIVHSEGLSFMDRTIHSVDLHSFTSGVYYFTLKNKDNYLIYNSFVKQ